MAILGLISAATYMYNLNGIKSKTVGDGQHGAARFATPQELKKTFVEVPYEPELWRKLGKDCAKLKLPQGIIVGMKVRYGLRCDFKSGKRWPFSLKKKVTALVETGDVHGMMVGAAGCGKTAYWLYPNLEYACASGMSFLTTDTKSDLYRNYGNICKLYGYDTAVIDLRNPTKSDSFNLLHLVNKYMDRYIGSKVLIIDAKYYTHTTQVQYNKHTLHSNNLYQIFTYVKNKDSEFGDKPHEVSGMLLYAQTEEAIQPDNTYMMSGNRISVKTLDLNCEFAVLAAQLDMIAKKLIQ